MADSDNDCYVVDAKKPRLERDSSSVSSHSSGSSVKMKQLKMTEIFPLTPVRVDSQKDSQLKESTDSCTVCESPLLFSGEDITDKESDDDTSSCHSIWYGSPLNEINFGPSTYPILPPLRSSPSHCVTVRTGTIKPDKGPPVPFPSSFKDMWDTEHVRMPYSMYSMYPISGTLLELKWKLIQKGLGREINNSRDLEQAIISYNTRFAKKWEFHQLHHYCNKHITPQKRDTLFKTIIPNMIQLVLSLPTLVTHAIPLLRKQQNYSLTLSQQQIACLLANAFFCTFPSRNSKAWGSEFSKFPSINFDTLFCGRPFDRKKMNKLDCIINYFQRVTTECPTGTVTFTRQACKSTPKWEQCDQTFTKLHITSEGTIEDNGHGMLQVDFANKFIGGGVLSTGCVQEEIRFLISPELLISRLFTEELDENESLLITGAERYSCYHGYAGTFEWSGDYVDSTLRDMWGRRQIEVVAIDALIFHRNTRAQFRPGLMHRELNKAYCGFTCNNGDTSHSSGTQSAVATGNWGCGAFGGEPRLKALIQWMAASVAGRDMVYFTFDKKSRELLEDIANIQAIVTQQGSTTTVGRVWKVLIDYYNQVVKEKLEVSLIDFLKQHLN